MKLSNLFAKLKSASCKRASKSKLLFFFIALSWFMLIIGAPLTQPAGTVDFDERGIVGAREHSAKYDNFNPSAKFIYSLGDSLCHQHASRSFFINGNQLPFCARCTGIFLGILLGACLGVFLVVTLKWYWIVGCLVPIGIDGTLQLFGLWESFNLLRLGTGILIGIITGVAICMILQELAGVFKS